MTTVATLPTAGRPRLARADFERLIGPYGLDLQAYPLVVAGVRGFFAAAGATPGNERNIYDDALVLYAPAVSVFQAFNGNTDPSRRRVGQGTTESSRGMASLNPGLWFAYRFDLHGSRAAPHEAICQRAAAVTVTRDGNPPYSHTGFFGINIHRGGNYSTSSEGCQTIPPTQWDEFISTAHAAARTLFGDAWRQRVIPYLLIDGDALEVLHGSAAPTRAQHAESLLLGTIRPTLQRIGLWSAAAEELLLGTALAERGHGESEVPGGGPHRGRFHMEPAVHDDIWNNFLRHRGQLANSVAMLAATPSAPSAAELAANDAYACAMARVHYLRVPDPLPAAGDIVAMAQYWKTNYDTAPGARSEEFYAAAWNGAHNLA